jgi:outer membrane receptor protein involved in Fe transport
LANPALTPEKLYGTEAGVGGDRGPLTWQATVFWNQLHDAIANVTTDVNVQMRENAGDINAYGVEADAQYAVNDDLSLNAAFDAVDASLNGNRPAQAPRWTATGGIEYRPVSRLTAFADFRYESRRFADDLNLVPLDPATTVDARVSWALTRSLSLYIYGNNLFNARVASTAAVQPVLGGTAIVTNFSAPRMVGGGLSFTQ